MDFVICDELVVEVKAVERLLPDHQAQLISNLRLSALPAGLLVNFHAETIRSGLYRLTLHPTKTSRSSNFRGIPRENSC
jgi:iron complex transport system substrate-binding protein